MYDKLQLLPVSSVLVPFKANQMTSKISFFSYQEAENRRLNMEIFADVWRFRIILTGKALMQNDFQSKPKPTEETTAGYFEELRKETIVIVR